MEFEGERGEIVKTELMHAGSIATPFFFLFVTICYAVTTSRSYLLAANFTSHKISPAKIYALLCRAANINFIKRL